MFLLLGCSVTYLFLLFVAFGFISYDNSGRRSQGDEITYAIKWT